MADAMTEEQWKAATAKVQARRAILSRKKRDAELKREERRAVSDTEAEKRKKRCTRCGGERDSSGGQPLCEECTKRGAENRLGRASTGRERQRLEAHRNSAEALRKRKPRTIASVVDEALAGAR